MAVDTMRNLLALHVTPADELDNAQVAVLSEAVQQVTGESVKLAYVDQGYTSDDPEGNAASDEFHLEVLKLPEAKKEFVLLPRRWVVERSFGWMARFRRLARDHERLASTLEGLHHVAFSFLMLHQAAPLFCWSSIHAPEARSSVGCKPVPANIHHPTGDCRICWGGGKAARSRSMSQL